MSSGYDTFELLTPRLRIRSFTEDDLEELTALYADPEVMRYLPSSDVDARTRAEESLPAFKDQFERSGFTLWAAEEREGGAFVGRVGLWDLDKSAEVEIAYVIAPRHWGKGYATESAEASLEFGFEELNLPEIAGVASPANHASLRVMEKLGFAFVRVGTFYRFECRYHVLPRETWRKKNADSCL